MPLFTSKDHPNTLAPMAPNNLLVMLHNLGDVRACCACVLCVRPRPPH